MFEIVIYVPDRHLVYDGNTPDRKGVGGGVTARIRLAEAWAALGHRVSIVGNVARPQVTRGVRYQPIDRVARIDCDVLVLTSSGGRLDLSPVLDLETNSRLREIWVHGTARIGGVEEVGYDYVVAVSNFVRKTLIREWGVPSDRIFVAYNGVQPYQPRRLFPRPIHRNPYRLVYTGHPAKGQEAALGVLRLLRAEDPRFELHIYGGRRLWGEAEESPPPEEGVAHHGLIGQRRLAAELRRSGFSIHLQAIQEGFGLGLVEAMAAGCIAIASPVGAIPELVKPGQNGFLFPGDHLSADTWRQAAETILKLSRIPDQAEAVRREALATPLDWRTLARSWVGHWAWALGGAEPQTLQQTCPECGGDRHLLLADGVHCVRCGLYRAGG